MPSLPLVAVAHRVVTIGMVSALLIALLPGAVASQDVLPVAVEDTFGLTGDARQDAAQVVWTITEADVQWRLELNVDGDERVAFQLSDASGDRVGAPIGRGRAALFDVALEPGTYTVSVDRTGSESSLFELVSRHESTMFDAEPNDTVASAVMVEPGSSLTGRLARTGGDGDLFAMSIAAGHTGLLDITLDVTTESRNDLCVRRDGQPVQCRGGVGALALPDLALEPGDYIISVQGSVDEDAPYQLSIGDARPRPSDGEAEPNDAFDTASRFDVTLGATGRSIAEDPDFHVVTIEGEPQLWQIRASGPQVYEVALVRGNAGPVAVSQPRGDGTDAVLDDLVLIPGEHVFSVLTLGDEYSLSLVPMGPPDPEAEREPNDDEFRAGAYGIGERRVGRLPTDEDIDHYRFTLPASSHLRLSLDQPADADIQLQLDGGGGTVIYDRAVAPGEPIDLDLVLPPGDYLLKLTPVQASEERYAITSSLLDPGDLSADQEPNDGVRTAQPAPRSLVLRGDRTASARDVDWFELPELTQPSTVTVHHGDAPPGIAFYAGVDAATGLTIGQSEDGAYPIADVPAETPLYLRLTTDGPYEVRLEADGWAIAPDPLEPAVEIGIELEHDTVAAYWPEGQQVGGTVMITNRGGDDLDLTLEAITSHYLWQAAPESNALAVPGGETVEVPLDVLIGPDAWAEAPVQLTVAAHAPDGGRTSASVMLEASRDASAVGSYLAWPVPDVLLGGLNVAGLALGGKTLGLIAPEYEGVLYDDLNPRGAGFSRQVSSTPAEFGVDLAGEAPVPIRGTILNPLAGWSADSSVPLRFELLLSTDGTTWASALEAELSPLTIDQAFALDEPVMATHAMLRVHSTQALSSGVNLGEWKVIAEPGSVPDSMPINIAAAVVGGHLARQTPYAGDYASWVGMLDGETRRDHVTYDRNAGRDLQLVIGFQEGRAAQITGLRWLDPDASQEETRVDTAEVAVALDGPLGPWERLGTWTFDRGPDGIAMPFDLPAPTWARFVRLTAPLPVDSSQVEFPARVEIHERATDAEYRSILGEWGYTSDRGPYEYLVPSTFNDVPLDPDAGDSIEDATPLELDQVRVDEAEFVEDVDWYRVTVPDGSNALVFKVEGIPSVGVGLTLVGADGEEQEMQLLGRPDGSDRYEATVEPGEYHVRVEQPPFNVVFTFDTSGSMREFLDFVLEGVREFALDVEPGREVVQVIPVSESPLLEEWSDQPLQLENAVNNFRVTGSGEASNIELGLRDAAHLLGLREGTRAILSIGDAESGALDLGPDVWRSFDAIQPIMYTVHVGATHRPQETRDRMQAWAASNGGEYSYPTTHAETERSFERMATRLRRPARYALTASAATVDRRPAKLSVVAPEGQPVALASGVALEVILDTSGSMLKKLQGKRRIDIAKASLRQLVGESIAEGVPVAFRVFGGNAKAVRCETRLALPLAPLDRKAALRFVKRIKAPKKAKTPIADALRQVGADLADVENRIVVLITDGDETCGGDPAAVIEELRAEGIDVNLNIVGFALDDEELKARMAGWAAAGDGRYFDASGAADLAAAVTTAVSAPYRVYAIGADEPIATGTVGGGPVELEPGEYRVEVLTEPVVEFPEVLLDGGGVEILELPEVGPETGG